MFSLQGNSFPIKKLSARFFRRKFLFFLLKFKEAKELSATVSLLNLLPPMAAAGLHIIEASRSST